MLRSVQLPSGYVGRIPAPSGATTLGVLQLGTQLNDVQMQLVGVFLYNRNGRVWNERIRSSAASGEE